jgi:tetratricopeptide (TPR) repeat protein
LSNAQKKPDQDSLERVITELEAGRTEKAYAALDELIKQYPNNPDAYFLRGSLKLEADPSQALSDFNKVIELKPDSGSAYNQRAILRLVNNDTTGALKDLDAAIAHDFKDDSVYYLRGQLRRQVGELKGALSDLDEALKLNPNNPRLYSSRGELLALLNEPDRA